MCPLRTDSCLLTRLVRWAPVVATIVVYLSERNHFLDRRLVHAQAVDVMNFVGDALHPGAATLHNQRGHLDLCFFLPGVERFWRTGVDGAVAVGNHNDVSLAYRGLGLSVNLG